MDNTDEKGCVTQFYLDKSDKKQPKVLYFFEGTGGNDLVVALFQGGDLNQIEKMIEETKRELCNGN